jgi:very-short-patch-repair endonuclease
MGWEHAKIAVEYDGDGHRERPRFRNDIVRSEYIAHLGWTHIRVVAGARRSEIILRVNRAWALRLH